MLGTGLERELVGQVGLDDPVDPVDLESFEEFDDRAVLEDGGGGLAVAPERRRTSRRRARISRSFPEIVSCQARWMSGG